MWGGGNDSGCKVMVGHVLDMIRPATARGRCDCHFRLAPERCVRMSAVTVVSGRAGYEITLIVCYPEAIRDYMPCSTVVYSVRKKEKMHRFKSKQH